MINNGTHCCQQTAGIANEASETLEATLRDVDLITSCTHEVAGATEQQAALSVQVERQAARLLELGNRSVESSENAREESEHLGNNVDQAQLLTSHFLQMLCDRLLGRLLELAGADEEFELPVTQEELAGMIGASRERVNKSLASFIKLGWLAQKGEKLEIKS